MFELDNGGIPKEVCCLMKHEGKGIDPVRQEGPHVHFSKYLNGMLYVCDLGVDTVFCYRVNEKEKSWLRQKTIFIFRPATVRGTCVFTRNIVSGCMLWLS